MSYPTRQQRRQAARLGDAPRFKWLERDEPRYADTLGGALIGAKRSALNGYGGIPHDVLITRGDDRIATVHPGEDVEPTWHIGLCEGSGSPAPCRATTEATCPTCGVVVALEAEPTGWGGAVLEEHPA